MNTSGRVEDDEPSPTLAVEVFDIGYAVHDLHQCWEAAISFNGKAPENLMASCDKIDRLLARLGTVIGPSNTKDLQGLATRLKSALPTFAEWHGRSSYNMLAYRPIIHSCLAGLSQELDQAFADQPQLLPFYKLGDALGRAALMTCTAFVGANVRLDLRPFDPPPNALEAFIGAPELPFLIDEGWSIVQEAVQRYRDGAYTDTEEAGNLWQDLRQLRDQIRDSLRVLRPLFASTIPNNGGETDKPAMKMMRPCWQLAYNSFVHANKESRGIQEESDVYKWLRDHGYEDYRLPDYETWKRYLRQARSVLKDNASPGCGRSMIPRKDLDKKRNDT